MASTSLITRGAKVRCLACLALAMLGPAVAVPAPAPAPACKGTIYLTFDTGSQSQAQFIAATLNQHQVKATFFLANEKTVHGDYSLDPAWAPYWRARQAEGHAFGSHTFDHVYLKGELADGRLEMQPQFGREAGKKLAWTQQQVCQEIGRVEQRFREQTGAALDPFWRAPGGRVTPRLIKAAGECGYAHVGWSAAGFSGDELPSERVSNASLLQRSLRDLRDGDIVMAHLGIWSRKDPWAPAVLEPLIVGLKKKGYCFATLRSHPDFRQTVQAVKAPP